MSFFKRTLDKIRHEVLFHEKGHFLLSFLIGFLFWAILKDLRLIFISLLAGFFIDIDHLFDYLCFVTNNFKKWSNLKFRLADFFKPSFYVWQTKKVYVLLHGWEYLLILYWLTQNKNMFFSHAPLVFFVSYAVHLLYDQISSAGSLLSYSLIYRALNKFNISAYSDQK